MDQHLTPPTLPVPTQTPDAGPFGLQVVLHESWAELGAELAGLLADSPLDPFELELLVVPDQSHRRSLSQLLAGSHGICAGVDFLSPTALRRRLESELLGLDAEHDPWRSRGLTLQVATVITRELEAAGPSCRPGGWCWPIAHHLVGRGPRPGRLMATSQWLARLLLRYARLRPEMLRSWARGEDRGPDGASLAATALCQPQLWRMLCERLPGWPDPVTRHDLLIAGLTGSVALDSIGPRVLSVHVEPPDQQWTELLTALARSRQVLVRQLAATQGETDFALRYGTLGAHAAQAWQRTGVPPTRHQASGPRPAAGPMPTLLGRLQEELRGGTPAPGPRIADGSVQVHGSHDRDRQVEVLREVLCDALDRNPDLEPRDIIVLCTDLAAYASAVNARLCLDPQSVHGLHPAHSLRVQLAGGSLSMTNPVLLALDQVLALEGSRATGQDLLDLCALPPVARRFGFGPEDLAVLTELVAEARIAWGVDGSHRADWGLPQVGQGTWLRGLDRMVAGIGLADEPPGRLGLAAPLAHLESGELDVIGRLAELVSRIRYLRAGWRSPADIGTWTERLREALDLLVEVDLEDSWQLAHAHTQLTELAAQSPATDASFSLPEARQLVSRLFRPQQQRGNYANGSLLVTQLGDVDAVEHQIVVILGLDDEHFPAREEVGGDDLLDADPAAALRGPRNRARQHLLNAVLAARREFIVITRSREPRGNAELPAPVVILDLLQACGVPGAAGGWRGGSGVQLEEGQDQPLVRHHALAAHDPANFESVEGAPAFSFDRAAYRGALDLSRAEAPPAVPAGWTMTFDRPRPEQVQVAELVAFYQNPAAALLRGLGLRQDWTPEVNEQLPVELNELSRWQVGDRLVELGLTGLDPGAAEQLVLLEGLLPAGVAARSLLTGLSAQASVVVQAVRQARQTGCRQVRVDLEVAGVRLTGSVDLVGDQVLVHRFGAVRPRERLRAWIPLLAVAASTDGPVSALCLGSKGPRCTLTAPSQQVATQLLGELVGVLLSGRNQLVPLPLRTAMAWCLGGPNRATDPDARARAEWQFSRSGCEWQDYGWSRFLEQDYDQLTSVPSRPDDPGVGDPSRFRQLARWLCVPIIEAATLSAPPAGGAR